MSPDGLDLPRPGPPQEWPLPPANPCGPPGDGLGPGSGAAVPP